MAVENWIDKICDLMSVSDGAGGHVRSYHVYDKSEFPESLSQFPCAITYIVGYTPLYSAGGPLKGIYRGRTELHLTDSVDKSKMPGLMLYLARLRNVCSGAMQLGGLVDHFILVAEPSAIVGPSVLQYGSEEPHLGYIVNWQVKADEAGETGYTIAL